MKDWQFQDLFPFLPPFLLFIWNVWFCCSQQEISCLLYITLRPHERLYTLLLPAWVMTDFITAYYISTGNMQLSCYFPEDGNIAELIFIFIFHSLLALNLLLCLPNVAGISSVAWFLCLLGRQEEALMENICAVVFSPSLWAVLQPRASQIYCSAKNKRFGCTRVTYIRQCTTYITPTWSA